jgi:hypothetical protein
LVRTQRQTNEEIWEADSNEYAINLNEKNKPHCLTEFRHGGFFFSALCSSVM